jgi:uncharacterized protein (DUF1697 family)
MERYIAFLRGINVGGKNLIRMDELSDIFERLGFTKVITYIQSGNVLFNSDSLSTDQLANQIEAEMSKSMGDHIPVMVRSVRALENLISHNPFTNYPKDQDIHFYLCFLKYRPEKIPPLPLISINDGLEIFHITEHYAFIVSRKVKGRYGFPNHFVEEELGVPATTRNWNTILRVIQK